MKKVEIIKPNKDISLKNDDENQSKKRVCAYCRVSTDSLEQEKSYESQIDEYKNRIIDNPNWIFVDVFSDEGISGTGTSKRTGFNEMIDACKAGKIDLIITKSISRFARNTEDCSKNIKLLKNEYNVEVFFDKENISTFDSKTEFVLNVLSSIAQEESRNISENTKMGIRKRFKDGKVICNTNRLLGYDKDDDGNLVINEDEAKIVSRIFKEYLEGKSYDGISKSLTEDNISTITGSKWWGSTIKSVLRNEKYYGTLLLQKTVTVDYLTKKRKQNKNIEPMYKIDNNHPAIVSKETFDLVQAEINRRFELTQGDNKDRKKYSNKYPFSGKIICGLCGTTYKRRYWNSGTKWQEAVWQCKDYINSNGCKSKAVKEKVLEQSFISLYNDVLLNKSKFYNDMIENINLIISTDSNVKNISKLQDQIMSINLEIRNLVQLKIKNRIDDNYYDSEYAELTFKVQEINNEIRLLEKQNVNQIDYKSKIDGIKKLFSDSKRLDSFDQEVFNLFIKNVIIKSPDHYIFILNDGQQYSTDYSIIKRTPHVECVALMSRAEC